MQRFSTVQTIALWGICLGFTAFSFWAFAFGHSPDLMATWLAGHFYDLGALDQIYPPDTDLYTMLPPSDWWPYLQSQGHDGSVFPFVYPPLWAVLASWVTPYAGIDTFQMAASVLNPLMMVWMFVFAARAIGLPPNAQLTALGLGLIMTILTLPGAVALEQNQPQILVSFLLVLAIERDRAGAAKTAGAVLALAAAIKLYPAIIALLWLATGRYRAVRAFLLAGGALGLASLALAGWPLHADFLHQIGVIKNSALVTFFTYGIDSSIAQIFASDGLVFIAGLDNAPDSELVGGWTVLAKGALWSNLSTLGLIVLTVAGAAYLRKAAGNVALVYAAFLVGVALLSPLSWGYHYLPALAFLPTLPLILGPRIGGAAVLAVVLPISIPSLEPLSAIPFDGLFPQIAGTLSMVGLGVILLLASRRKMP